MVPLDRKLVSSYRLSTVTMSLSATSNSWTFIGYQDDDADIISHTHCPALMLNLRSNAHICTHVGVLKAEGGGLSMLGSCHVSVIVLL